MDEDAHSFTYDHTGTHQTHHGGGPSRAVVLVSGGLDSATVLAMAINEGYKPSAISFDYGQRHRFELEAARKICAHHDVGQHIVFPLDLRSFGGSTLTSDEPVAKDRSDAEISEGIPATYVPARNTIFLSLAMAWAETLGIYDLFIGVNAVDYSGYPDCRPEFIGAFENLANLATRSGIENPHWRIHTPLISLSKAEIIHQGIVLGVDYGLTHSCYDPDPNGRPCGRCDSCRLRHKGFVEAGIPDPRNAG